MARRVLGALLCVVGAVWIGQGVGVVKGSFMSGEAIWAVIGIVVIVFGIVLIRGGRSVPPDDID
jgi:hypothetical protein